MVNWFPWGKRGGSDVNNTSQQSHVHTAPKHSLPITNAVVLLAAPHRQAMIRQLADLVSCPKSDFESLYLGALKNYAQLVQELPASEAHHHAGRGGMLDHGLETVVRALTLRRGHMLPPDATPEEQNAKQDVWAYGIFTAALLHDIGKPLADQQVALVSESGKVVAIWNPWSGPMDDDYAGYRTAFVRNRDYGLHERVAPLLVHQVVPSIGMAWLTNERPLLNVWLAAIQGDIGEADIVGQIIKEADQHSVAQNLVGAEGKVQLVTTQVKSLTERLVAGLRHLVDEGKLPLNRRGAGGWCDGSDIWLVSKRTLDDLRTHMISEGQTGIPHRNDRLMDELQQNGILTSTHDERAIWKATVSLEDGWSQSLTLLRIPITKLWPNDGSQPAIMDGQVTPDNEPATAVADNAAETAPVEATTTATPATNADNSADSAPKAPATANSADLDALPLPPGVDGLEDLPLPPLESAVVTSNADDGQEDVAVTTRLATAKVPGTTSAIATPIETAEAVQPTKDLAETIDKDAGSEFIAWLVSGITEYKMEINTAKARVHIVDEGLLLVSPVIFKDFNAISWGNAQKRFLKLNKHTKNGDLNVWHYAVRGGTRPISGLLIPDYEDLGIPAIPTNKKLSIKGV